MFVLYFWKCRENPLTPPRKKKTTKKTQTTKRSALNYIDVQICLGEGRKIEMPAWEESKGLAKRASSKGTCRFALQCKRPPQTTERSTACIKQPFPALCLPPAVTEAETLVLPACCTPRLCIFPSFA